MALKGSITLRVASQAFCLGVSRLTWGPLRKRVYQSISGARGGQDSFCGLGLRTGGAGLRTGWPGFEAARPAAAGCRGGGGVFLSAAGRCCGGFGGLGRTEVRGASGKGGSVWVVPACAAFAGSASRGRSSKNRARTTGLAAVFEHLSLVGAHPHSLRLGGPLLKNWILSGLGFSPHLWLDAEFAAVASFG